MRKKLAQQEESKKIKITEFITVGEIATLMEVSSNDIISACMSGNNGNYESTTRC